MQKYRMTLRAVDIFSGGLQGLLFLYQQLPLLCQRREQSPPAPSSLRQSSRNGSIWPAGKQPLPAPALCLPSGKRVRGQNGSRQRATSWATLRTLTKSEIPPLSFSFSYSVLGLALSILCHF